MPKKSIDYSKCCIYKIEHIDNENLTYVGHTTDFNKRKGQHKSSCKNNNDKAFNYKLYQMIRNNGGFEMFKMIEICKYPCNDRREAERKENEVMKELKSNMNSYKSYITEEEKKYIQKEYYEDNKEKIKQYREDNKEKIKEYYKQYCEDNRVKVEEYKKEYYDDNKEKISEKQKEYYNDNKRTIKDKVKQYQDNNIEKIKKYLKDYRESNMEIIKEYREKNKEEINRKKREFYKNNLDKIKESLKEKIICKCGCEVNKHNSKRHEKTKKHIDLMNEKNK